jgi:hypothetical protein
MALKQAYAATDRLFLRGEVAATSELRSGLKNERGYFSLRSGELGLTYEPVVDLLLSTSYAVVAEREEDSRSGRRVQVASDQYGLAAQYRRGSWTVGSRASYRIANTGLEETGLEGSVAWQL